MAARYRRQRPEFRHNQFAACRRFCNNAFSGDELLVPIEDIKAFGRRLGREFHADCVVLFGSYAHGAPTIDSDVDLLVILPFEGKPVYKSVEMRLKLRPSFPVDLLVRTPEQVRERLEMGDCFMQEVLEKGKVLYEADGC
ncbi:MAG TPA: nucleotidyltransferase domain-containing protein [Candidatus Hydrogenedentes bacterium]|nr:nucleotidyltransferase domain-containing protein [Candidatus Hydrogenedentota bacterium]